MRGRKGDGARAELSDHRGPGAGGSDHGGVCGGGSPTRKLGCFLGEPDGQATGGGGSRGHGHVGSVCAIDPEPCAWGGGQDRA